MVRDMDLNRKLEDWLGPIFALAIGLGLAFPSQAAVFEPYTMLFLAIALFFSFLRIDITKVAKAAKRPLLLIYTLVVSLIAIPVLFFFLAKLISPDAAAGILLYFAAPTAALNVFIIQLFRGDSALGVVLQFLHYLVAPFTFSALAFSLASSSVLINPIYLLVEMLGLLILPMIAAQLAKRLMDTGPLEKQSSAASVVTTSLIALGIIGKDAGLILPNVARLAPLILLLCLFYILAAVIGYNMAFWLGKKERIALSVNKTFMNGSLVFVLASKFFAPGVVIVAVANAIGWYLFLAFAKSVNLYERIGAISPNPGTGMSK